MLPGDAAEVPAHLPAGTVRDRHGDHHSDDHHGHRADHLPADVLLVVLLLQIQIALQAMQHVVDLALLSQREQRRTLDAQHFLAQAAHGSPGVCLRLAAVAARLHRHREPNALSRWRSRSAHAVPGPASQEVFRKAPFLALCQPSEEEPDADEGDRGLGPAQPTLSTPRAARLMRVRRAGHPQHAS